MVEGFGLLAVCMMVVFYAFEGRAAIFTLAFAGACLCAATYAFMIGSYPFMIAEGIWAIVAVRKWILLPSTET